MKFKGFHKLSVIDYPEKLCALGFTGGCNFRCHYCHNPELVIDYKNLPDIDEDEIIKFMKKRKGILDGFCITGGEPTIHKDLPKFMKKIKNCGFLVKLDTNGTNPEMLIHIIKEGLIDYVAMDIKGAPGRYPEIVGENSDLSKINESVKVIMQSKIDYEFRTTVFPKFFGEEDAKKIGEWIVGAKHYVLQQPRVVKTLDKNFKKAKLYTNNELKEFTKFLPNCIIR